MTKRGHSLPRSIPNVRVEAVTGLQEFLELRRTIDVPAQAIQVPKEIRGEGERTIVLACLPP
jgi:hypothetical protein